MREIKFRGKQLGSGEWVYGHFIKTKNHKDNCYISQGDPYNDMGMMQGFVNVDPETVGQSTGLKDNNGKEIYEGDIIVTEAYPFFDNQQPNYRGVVEWIYSQWQVVLHCVNVAKAGISEGINQGLNDIGLDEGERFNDVLVIGNVHENPELLEEK
jgi:uncharacterized phage protein (TIGR01671 family)